MAADMAADLVAEMAADMAADNKEVSMIGKFVLVRGNYSGVYCGVLLQVHNTTVELADIRNIHRWDGANTLLEMSIHGCAERYTRISEPAFCGVILDACLLLVCTSQAEANLRRSRWAKD